LVVGERYSLFVYLSVTALVDQLTDGLEVWLAGDFSASVHVYGFSKTNP